MKQLIREFIRRGISACWIGPLVLAAIYLLLWQKGAVESLAVPQVCRGILSLSALAFIAGGMNAIYRIERLPLMVAVFIHGAVLYVSYLATYLLNGWLEWGRAPILVFSGIFIVGYLVIWVVIYAILKRNTNKINEKLKSNQQKLA